MYISYFKLKVDVHVVKYGLETERKLMVFIYENHKKQLGKLESLW